MGPEGTSWNLRSEGYDDEMGHKWCNPGVIGVRSTKHNASYAYFPTYFCAAMMIITTRVPLRQHESR